MAFAATALAAAIAAAIEIAPAVAIVRAAERCLAIAYVSCWSLRLAARLAANPLRQLADGINAAADSSPDVGAAADVAAVERRPRWSVRLTAAPVATALAVAIAGTFATSRYVAVGTSGCSALSGCGSSSSSWRSCTSSSSTSRLRSLHEGGRHGS